MTKGNFIRFSKIACSYARLDLNVYDKIADKRTWCASLDTALKVIGRNK